MLELCEAVLRRAGSKAPADAVLREVLKRAGPLPPGVAGAASRGVFAFYRWFGWVGESRPWRRGVEEALQLAERFRRQPGSFTDQELLAKAVPSWVAGEVSLTPEWARSLQEEPRLWLRVKRGAEPEVLAELPECQPSGLPGLERAWEYRGEADLFRSAAFLQGRIEIQDISSQWVGLLADPKPGQTWWDACAGEGGKTLLWSELMENRGLIWASDRAEWRLARLRRRAARAGVFNYRVAAWDGGERLPTRTRFDGVLVDAPCTGMGTWQRNPHARWTTSRADVEELAARQLALLSRAAAAVKPAGKLIYAVCTLTRRETTAVAEALGQQQSGLQPLALGDGQQGAAAPGEIWLWPWRTRGNGMYVAGWHRA